MKNNMTGFEMFGQNLIKQRSDRPFEINAGAGRTNKKWLTVVAVFVFLAGSLKVFADTMPVLVTNNVTVKSDGYSVIQLPFKIKKETLRTQFVTMVEKDAGSSGPGSAKKLTVEKLREIKEKNGGKKPLPKANGSGENDSGKTGPVPQVRVDGDKIVFYLSRPTSGTLKMYMDWKKHPVMLNVDFSKDGLAHVKFYDPDKQAKNKPISSSIASVAYEKALININRHLYRNKLPEGFDRSVDNKEFSVKGLRFKRTYFITGQEYGGGVYEVTNTTDKVLPLNPAALLSQKQFKSGGLLAVETKFLLPGEKSQVYRSYKMDKTQ